MKLELNKSWKTRIMFGKPISRKFLLMSDIETKTKYMNTKWDTISVYPWINMIYTEIKKNLETHIKVSFTMIQRVYCLKIRRNMQWNPSFLRINEARGIIILTLGKSRYLYFKENLPENPKGLSIKLKEKSLVYISNPQNILKSSLRTKSPKNQDKVTHLIMFFVG